VYLKSIYEQYLKSIPLRKNHIPVFGILASHFYLPFIYNGLWRLSHFTSTKFSFHQHQAAHFTSTKFSFHQHQAAHFTSTKFSTGLINVDGGTT
jgi:hypothetical protein